MRDWAALYMELGKTFMGGIDEILEECEGEEKEDIVLPVFSNSIQETFFPEFSR